MSESINHNRANSKTTVSYQFPHPCVQYGFPDGPAREPKLRSIYDSIPKGATTVSPIYGLTREQYEHQDQLENYYNVDGYTMIATELQDECEADNRVLHPIHIESDVYLNEGPETLNSWFQEFVEDYLKVPVSSCSFYFSGNRSIHLHVPRFIKEEQIRTLKELAKSFCEKTGAQLDCGIYSSKRLFRIPGVRHKKTGLSKVKIEPSWNHERIIRASSSENTDIPFSYADVLKNVFVSQPDLTVKPVVPDVDAEDIFQILDSDKTVLELDSNEDVVETPLIEDQCPPSTISNAEMSKWCQYNTKEFSPYANATGNPRSVAVVKVKGGAFARKDLRNGETMVPVYFYGAIGCDGEFTKENKHGPLQLSKRDYAKWDYAIGDKIVIIGGRSRNSRIFQIDDWDATVAGHALTDEGASREDALGYLKDQGYEIGNAGSKNKNRSTKTRMDHKAVSIWPARSHPNSEAERFQHMAEENGIKTLSHTQRARIACRLLRYGWDPAWNWFKKEFGQSFKPNVTWEQFNSIIKSYPEYDHVEVPSRP